jgi:glycolate oxidase FAD binding subunit
MVGPTMPLESIADFGEQRHVQVTQPTNAAEVGQAVRDAAARGIAVFPLGGRTMLHLGYPPTKPGIGIDLRCLDQVIDYPARDMTITVQAGITIANLQAILANENQQLPIDVPKPEEATLGGAIAVNASGPRRNGYGTLRDYVIGISFINDQGEECKAGGRVIKNVAGYDLMKLHIGALGTLGIVTQVTLKLRPKTESRMLLAFDATSEMLDFWLGLLHATPTRPSTIDLLNSHANRKIQENLGEKPQESEWSLVVGFEGNEEAVSWQFERFGSEMPRKSVQHLSIRVGEGSGPLYSVLAQSLQFNSSGLGFKVSVLSGRASALCRFLIQNYPSLALQAHAGNGIVHGHVDDLTLDQARTMLSRLDDAIGPDGNLIVMRCPTEWKRELPIWGKPRGDIALMRRVKQALDPRGIFNPGRFVDGI